MNIIDTILNKLGYISSKEYEILLIDYNTKIRELKQKHKEEFKKLEDRYTGRPHSKQGRRMGNSTRLADYYIQELMTKNKIQVVDHYGTREACKILFRTVIKRLDREHGVLIRQDKVKVNGNRFTIELID